VQPWQRDPLGVEKPQNNEGSKSAVERLVVPGPTTAETSKFKFSNISWLKGDLQQCVLRAAVDWQRFQSAENAQALYVAVMAMQGLEPENIHLLDGES
jgi:hypothetical protein